MGISKEGFVNIFVYGSLKQGFPAHDFLEGGEFLGVGKLDGYALYPVCSWPGIKSKKGHTVIGEVFRIPIGLLESLDSYEGYPDLFDRKEVQLELIGENLKVIEDSTITCYVYTYNGDVNNLSPILSGKWEL